MFFYISRKIIKEDLVLEGSDSNGRRRGLGEDAVVVLDEDITQNPETILATLDTREAVAGAITESLVGQISNGDVEGLASELEADVVLALLERAGDHPTVAGVVLGALDLAVDGLGSSIADNDQGRTSVNDTLGGLLEGSTVERGILDQDLPVSLLGHGSVGQRASEL